MYLDLITHNLVSNVSLLFKQPDFYVIYISTRSIYIFAAEIHPDKFCPVISTFLPIWFPRSRFSGATTNTRSLRSANSTGSTVEDFLQSSSIMCSCTPNTVFICLFILFCIPCFSIQSNIHFPHIINVCHRKTSQKSQYQEDQTCYFILFPEFIQWTFSVLTYLVIFMPFSFFTFFFF